MGRQDIHALGDQMSLWDAQEEIRHLRQAQETINRHLAAIVTAARKGTWREMDALSDKVAWDSLEARHDFFVEFGALCAIVEHAEKGPAAACEFRTISRIETLGRQWISTK